MEATGSGRVHWSAAAALSAAVVLLSALDAVPLVALPLAIVVLAMRLTPRWKWMALGLFLCLVGIGFPAGRLADLSRSWSLLLGSTFVFCTLWRPAWAVLPRALLAVGVTLSLAGIWGAATGGLAELDSRVHEHLLEVSAVAFGRFREQAATSAWAAQFVASAREMAELQWRLFPALLGLQSLAALALVSWVVARLRRAEEDAFELRPLRDFRFNDQLVWIVIAGLVLLILPLGALATRLGYNALLFMGGLYALRGLGVFVFLTGGSPTLTGMIFGAIALLFLYPVVLTTALLVGLGDTWLDVRARATLARRS